MDCSLQTGAAHSSVVNYVERGDRYNFFSVNETVFPRVRTTTVAVTTVLPSGYDTAVCGVLFLSLPAVVKRANEAIVANS